MGSLSLLACELRCCSRHVHIAKNEITVHIEQTDLALSARQGGFDCVSAQAYQSPHSLNNTVSHVFSFLLVLFEPDHTKMCSTYFQMEKTYLGL